MHGPVLKEAWVSAHARNHVICSRYPKCPIAVVLADVDLPYWTSKVEHLRPFSATFVLRICRNGYLWTSGDLATFFVDFCILYSECPTYFYFRFVWPTDLESIPHASTPTMIILTKFEVDMTIHCRVTAFLSRHVTWWIWPLTFWPWTVVIHGGSRDQPCHQVWRPYSYSFMSYELQRFPLISIGNANAATAHAPDHVTRE